MFAIPSQWSMRLARVGGTTAIIPEASSWSTPLDRLISVRLYRVIRQNHRVSFVEALRRILRGGLAEREREIEPELFIRLERADVDSTPVAGELVRLQTTNLPSRADPGTGIQPLGIPSIGHSTAFVYDPSISAIAFQVAKNGITTTRLSIYLAQLLGGLVYDFHPIPSADVAQKLADGRIRALEITVANPAALQIIDEQDRPVRDGLRAMQQALGSSQIGVSLSMGHERRDLPKRRTMNIVRWLRGQEDALHGNVQRLSAKVAPADGGQAELLDLLEAQMGGRRTLELPDDNPDQNFRARAAFARAILVENQEHLRRRDE